MQKTFTVQVPDELWVNTWDLNNSVDYEYSGPEEVYALIDDRKNLISFSINPGAMLLNRIPV